MSISIVVTVKDEENVLPKFLESLLDAVRSFSFSVSEIIFVDGGSTDGTLQLLEKFKKKTEETYSYLPRIRILHQPLGTKLAYAEYLGIASSASETIIKMDSDLQHDPDFIQNLVDCSGDHDVVVASRYIANGGNSWSPFRGVISRVAKLEAALLMPTRRKTHDPLSGFYLLRRNAIPEKPPYENGYKFLMQILLNSKCQRVKEIPYKMNDRTQGKSKIVHSTIKMILNFNKEILYNFRAKPYPFEEPKVPPEYSKSENFVVISRASFISEYIGGADRFATNVVKDLSFSLPGEDKIAFVGRGTNALRESRVRVINVPTKASIESSSRAFYYFKGFILNLMCALTGSKFLNENREYKYANAHSNVAAILVRILNRKVNVVFTNHDVLFSITEKKDLPELLIRLINNFLLERLAIRLSHAVITVSPRVLEQVPRIHRHKVTMKFPTGGPIPFLSDDSRNNSLTKFSNVRNKYFVSVGYQNGRKRFDLLLKSWKNVNSGYDLCVVGDGFLELALKLLVIP